VSIRRANGWVEGPRGAPFGLLGAILLTGFVEGIVAGHWQAFTTSPTLNARYSAQATLGAATRVPVLCFGDSQIKFGIDPRVIKERSGRPAFNLAVAGSPLPLSYFLFRRALEAGARPPSVILGLMTLAAEPDASIPLFAEFASLRDCLDLALSTGDPVLPVRILIARAFPSFRYRHAIRSQLLDGLVKAERQSRGASEHLALWNAHNGGEMVTPEPGKVVHLTSTEKSELYGNPWRVSALNANYFHRFMALAESRGINVYWVVAPIVPEAQKHRDELGLDAVHSKNLQALQAPHSNLVLLDARHAGFATEEFHDSCHLNQIGAERLSAAIGEAIAKGDGDASRIRDLATLLPKSNTLRR
jgi:hypothetical protein